MSSVLRGLNACGCCSGTAVETPSGVSNRPGLSAIAYRVGTHPTFKASLLARLSTSGLASLNGLRTRDDGDFSIALLDAFSTMADVLTFYQERIANESYLRTATERRSILELARLIGYELDPGVAATTYLAFTVEDAPGGFGRAISVASTMPTAPEVPPPVTVPVRTKLQTVPGPGELPQMFETVETIEARSIWNAMTPRLSRPQTLSVDMNRIYLAGVATNLKKGNRLLIIANGNKELRTVVRVTPSTADDRTLVELEPLPAVQAQNVQQDVNQQQVTISFDLNAATVLDVSAIQSLASMTLTEQEMQTIAANKGWDRDTLAVGLSGSGTVTATNAEDGVFVFRQSASIFGYNAPQVDPTKVPPNNAAAWNNDRLEKYASPSNGKRRIHLDRVYDEVLAGSWIVIENPGGTRAILPVTEVTEVARTQTYVNGKSTRLMVVSGSLNAFRIRRTSALVQSEKLELAEMPIETEIRDTQIELDGDYAWLSRGRVVAITGTRDDLPTEVVSEIRTLENVTHFQGYTTLTVDPALEYSYVRETVTVNANVAFATHGETVSEVLGSGDAAQPFQKFKLKQPPLTWVGADNETGSVSTLEVRVNEVLWEEVPSLYGHASDERIYVIRRDDDHNSYVVFGDGKTGARLPTGANNVTAVYRRGIGTAGNVRASQISTLMNKPVGVKGATNPVEASGAGDPEQLEDARTNASLTALTLGRVVSLRDYEDFARAYPGIAKATASWSWSGQRRHILLTVAGDGGATVDPEDDLSTRLVSAIRKLGDEHVGMTLKSYVPLTFTVKARVKVDPAYLTENVFEDIKSRLSEAFSFEARSFGQSVSRAEVIAVMHQAAGVIAVDIEEFYSSEGSPSDDVQRIGAHPKTRTGPARLLTLDTVNEVRLEVMK